MLINAGKYIGSGVFRLDKEKATQKIECLLEITISSSEYVIQGYWQKYSRKDKYEFILNIDKFTTSNIDNVVITYFGDSLFGALNSIDDYATGVFTTQDRLRILGVTVLTSDNGYRVSGALISNHKAMFDIKLLSSDPKLANANVVNIVGKSA